MTILGVGIITDMLVITKLDVHADKQTKGSIILRRLAHIL
jgi:hypothetical protein